MRRDQTFQSMTTSIRAANLTDADAIGSLLAQLGYPALPAEVVMRMTHMERFPNTVVLMADVDGTQAAVITGHAFPSIHSATIVAYITALVVSDRFRGHGVGRMLVAAVEAWAAGLGAAKISVSSGVQRADAHAFYEKLGYDRSGIRFSKSLT